MLKGLAMRLAALVLALFTGAAQAEIRIIDGDSLEVDGVTIRLFGIDAAEWRDPGGREATADLRRLVGGRDPDCRRVDTDRYGRTVALCSVGGADLSLSMVRAGWAVAWCDYLRRQRPALLPAFQAAEADARGARRGMWARPFRAWRAWGC
jgi:endonuclease YncB( thermonuclease family)